MNPSVVTAKRHEQVNYLDLDMSLQLVLTRGGATIRVLFQPYHKPGNAYAYIPFTSFLHLGDISYFFDDSTTSILGLIKRTSTWIDS